METKTTFNASNFSQGNTPKPAQNIGDYLLIAAAVGGAVVALPATIPALVIPPLVTQVALWLTALGSIGKVFTKFFGTEPKVQE